MAQGDATVSDRVQPLTVAFYVRPTDEVARSLLGCILLSICDGALSGGRIVETEAYLGPEDPASHLARSTNGKAAIMFGRPGTAYVYRSYGIHAMLNAVAHDPSSAGAVLIRAIEPVFGIEQMRSRRGIADTVRLCAGPGRLCQALGINLDLHGIDLTARVRCWIEPGEPPLRIATAGRVGIRRALDWPLRFFEADSRFVSAPRLRRKAQARFVEV